MLRLPRLLSPTNPAIAGEGPLSPPTPQGAPFEVSPPLPATCSAGPVVQQSCSMPVSSLHRVLGEVVDKVHDGGASAEGLQHDHCATALCNYSGNDDEKSHYCALRWQRLLAFTTDGRVKRLERLSAASERALVAGRLRGDVNGRSSLLSVWCLGESELHQGSECSSAHACRALRIRGVLITADYCSGRLQIKRNQSIIALHWRPALTGLTRAGRRQRSERRSPSTDFALPPGSPSGSTAAAQEHARPPMLLTPCPTRTDFSHCGRAGLLSPVLSVVFLLYRPHRHRVSLSPSAPKHPRSLPLPLLLLSLVPVPLPAFQAVHQLRHPFPAGLCFSPTAIWDLKCLPAFLRSLEHPLHPYHRQNFFAVHSLASWTASPT
jgi:hypothetical protein